MGTRRSFIRKAAASAAGIALAGNLTAGLTGKESNRKIHVFTKCLQFLSYDEMAEVLAEFDFGGADLTVRPGGQVLPENVETDLPKALQALRKQGLDSEMITTSITDADDQYTIPILKTMADLGIRYYRTGYFSYDSQKSIERNLAEHKNAVQKLESLNRRFGVCGNYQNHSGTQVGGPVWDLHHLLKDSDPEFMGVQYDIRHATVEGGTSWPLGMKLLAPWIKTTDIKDFIWEKTSDGKWIIKNVPLGEGMVDFETYLKMYKSFGIDAPVSIHYEYDLGGAEHGNLDPTMSTAEIKKWLEKDLDFLRARFREYNL